MEPPQGPEPVQSLHLERRLRTAGRRLSRARTQEREQLAVIEALIPLAYDDGMAKTRIALLGQVSRPYVDAVLRRQ